MANTLIIDNWLLQTIGESLVHGLSSDTANELVIDSGSNTHHLRDVPEGGVQIEALLTLLVDIVLRDTLVVDSGFTESWEAYNRLFSDLISQGLVRPLDFRSHSDRLREPKQFILDQLCVTSSLRDAQRRNEKSWSTHRIADDPYMSAVIWGTAGMLSRSHVFEAPYSGHPLRRRLLEQSMMTQRRNDEVVNIQEWITGERIRLFEMQTKNATHRQASLVLPPVAVDVINESSSIHDLIPVALQLRHKYRKLREWLGEIQNAMETEDAKQVAKYKKTLDTVAKDISRAVVASEGEKVSLEIGVGWPSLSIPLPTFRGVLSRFGIRALLSQQIFAPRGEAGLRKLLMMFGEKDSRIGLNVFEYLGARRMRKSG